MYTYDQLNRIAAAHSPGTDCTVLPSGLTKDWGQTFTIDIWGNLTNIAVERCSTPMLSVAVNTKNRIVGYTYDAAGNLTNTSAHTYAYDAENRMNGVDSVTYTYDGDGKRVKKSNGKLYWTGTGSDALTETDLSGNPTADYIFLNGRRIARLDLPSAAVHYYFSDHLGSSNVVTNATGTTIEEESDFYPFGGERVLTSLLPDQNYKFTGKERDTESNLDYFGARYYSSNLGRFISSDEFAGGPVDAFSPNDPLPDSPLPYAEITNPQSLNKYTYTYNNPLRYTDPNGHDGWDFALGVLHAWATDNIGGIGRVDPYNEDNAAGMAAGDRAAIVQGAAEIQGAEAGAGSGTLLVLSLAGAPEGAIVLTGSAILGAHGAGTAASGLLHLAKSTDGKAAGPKVGSTDGPGSGKRATPAQREETLKENKGKCVFCGKKATQVDHAVPRSRGGDTTRKNLQPACQPCNQQKGAKTTREYVKWKKKHSK